jgi:MFS family permease
MIVPNYLVLYTISNLIIADAFPPSKQSLAGGVFNTVSQIGNSVGLTVGAVIAATVTGATHDKIDQISSEKLMKGFRGTFWACFASLGTVVLVSLWGLRRAGKVGLKKE